MFSASGRADWVQVVTYYCILFETEDTREFRTAVRESFQRVLRFPMINAVAFADPKSDEPLRSIKVWRFRYLYRFTDTEVVIERIVHEAADVDWL